MEPEMTDITSNDIDVMNTRSGKSGFVALLALSLSYCIFTACNILLPN